MIQDLKIVRDSATKDIAYVEWIEGPTKTRKAGLNKRPRPLTQKLLRTGGPRCSVMFFEKLLSKRPPSLQSSGPLYLTPLRKNDWSTEVVW